jgi:hypothetical protein
MSIIDPQRDTLTALWCVLGPNFCRIREEHFAGGLSWCDGHYLIHGAWSLGEQLAPACAAFEGCGYATHTPTLRHHELPLRGVLRRSRH